jgi:transposase
MRKPQIVILNLKDRAELERWSEERTLPAKQLLRADVLLMADAGNHDSAIAARLHICRQTCGRIRKSFLAEGLQALAKDQPRRGRPPRIKGERILTLTTGSPPAPATDWSRALLAEATGMSASSVGRILRRNGIHLHPFADLKVGDGPRFAEKLEAIVGLYLAPPKRALVLCVDENRRIEPLARLPLPQERRRTNTTLSAALNTLDGAILSTGQAWPHHQEFLRFLQQIDTQTSAGRRLHLFIGNDDTPTHPKVNAWLDKHPWSHVEFTTISGGWLHMVARFFQGLTTRLMRHGMIQSMTELEAAITEYIEAPQAARKPFSWTAKVADIHAKDALDKVQK